MHGTVIGGFCGSYISALLIPSSSRSHLYTYVYAHKCVCVSVGSHVKILSIFATANSP